MSLEEKSLKNDKNVLDFDWEYILKHEIHSICFISNHLKIDMVEVFKNQPLEIPSCLFQLLTLFLNFVGLLLQLTIHFLRFQSCHRKIVCCTKVTFSGYRD